ncbi:unnamed protein product, partial [Clonostachys rosea f. rosea IK726]
MSTSSTHAAQMPACASFWNGLSCTCTTFARETRLSIPEWQAALEFMKSIDGVKVDVWETDSKGLYDVQYNNRSGPDGGGVVVSDDDGCFHFKAIVPVPYPIPDDGPVGKLLCKLNRHPYRPSHMHFMFHKPGFDQLITALYVRGSKHETSDAVFGVKQSLIVNITKVADEEGWADKYGV